MKIKNNIKWISLSLFLAIVAVFSFAVYNHNKSSKSKALSVIIPIYDVASYLPKCLDSLVGQTFIDIEIVCVNDGSNDNSLEIIKEYEKKDKRIIVVDKENGGVSSARNAGIRASHGEYLTFVDPDDYIDTDAYEKCMSKIRENNADILVFDFILEPEKKQTVTLPEKIYTNPFDAVKDQSVNTGFVWNKIFRRSIIVDNSIWFKEDIKYAEDNLFVNMVIPKSKMTITNPGVFYHYLCRTDSSGYSVPQERRVSDAVKRCKYLVDYYNENGYKDNYVWLLDQVLFIATNYTLEDKERNKIYTKQILDLLDNKLLHKMDEIPKHLSAIIDNLRTSVKE